MTRCNLRSGLIKAGKFLCKGPTGECFRENSVCRGPVVKLSLAGSRNSKVSERKTLSNRRPAGDEFGERGCGHIS